MESLLYKILSPKAKMHLIKFRRESGIFFLYDMLVQKYMQSLTLEQLAAYRRRLYKKYAGEWMDYEHPKNICEKAQQLMIYDAQPYKTQWADKYLAKELARERIGEEHIIKTLGVWKHFDEIDFDTLPDSFVLKANHGSGWNIMVKDKNKLNKTRAKKLFDRWMKLNFGATKLCELHYRKIEPRILAEELLCPKNGKLLDYKFIMINGEPIKCIFMNKKTNRNTKAIFDKNGSLVLQEGATEKIDPPENLDEMVSMAKKLSVGMNIVRVDLYDVDGKIYFGELTFTPYAFRHIWSTPEKWGYLSESAKAFARTGLPEQITEL